MLLAKFDPDDLMSDVGREHSEVTKQQLIKDVDVNGMDCHG